MKIFTVIVVVLVSLQSVAALADEYVNGYYRKDGTYVQPYTRSSPDKTVTNNYSYRGNTNPYTGQTGTNRDTHDTTSQYYSGPDNHGKVGHPYGEDQ